MKINHNTFTGAFYKSGESAILVDFLVVLKMINTKMMKYFTLLFLLVGLGLNVRAQDNTKYGPIIYTDHFYDLENRWVVVSKNEQLNKYVFGFVYVDMQAGFTLKVEGTFGVDAKGNILRDSSENSRRTSMTIVRLGPNTKLLWAIPGEMLKDIYVSKVPDWLANYHHSDEDRNSVAFKVTMGKHLNSAGAPKQALVYLEDAYKKDPHAAGLEFELTYSYNEQKQYDKAINILKSAIASAPEDPLFYRELGFAYMKSQDYDNAIKAYNKGIAVAKQHNSNSRMEIVQNLTFVYCELKQFDKAIGLMNETITDVPNNGSLYILLAGVYLKKDDTAGAIKAYEKGIDVLKPAEMEAKAQIAYSIALLYKDKQKDIEQYNAWGKTAKEWAPANSKIGQALKNMNF